MTRPSTHKPQRPLESCANCKYAHVIAYKRDLLCFHDDNILVFGKTYSAPEAEFVMMNGDEVGMLDGDEYADVWAKRIVDHDDVCDEWEKVEE